MDETNRVKYLRIALPLVAGVIFIVGMYPLTIIWPSGWSWHAGQSGYLPMILDLYATLGVFLLIASRKPFAHLSLIWFTVVVQHCARWNHGSTVVGEPRAHGASLRRCSGATCCRCRPCAADPKRCGSKTCLSEGMTPNPAEQIG